MTDAFSSGVARSLQGYSKQAIIPLITCPMASVARPYCCIFSTVTTNDHHRGHLHLSRPASRPALFRPAPNRTVAQSCGRRAVGPTRLGQPRLRPAGAPSSQSSPRRGQAGPGGPRRGSGERIRHLSSPADLSGQQYALFFSVRIVSSLPLSTI